MYKTVAHVDGMMCGMCEAHIQDAVRKGLSVQSVKASHRKNEVVILSELPLTADDLHKVIDPTGYELVSVESLPYTKKRFCFPHLFCRK